MGGAILRTIQLRASFVTVVILGLVSILSAQESKGPATAPVPVQISTAQKVFISNAGGSAFETRLNLLEFNGGPDRPYNQFYAAMKGWGRYELVASPAVADLVLEISCVHALRLLVIDPKTHVTLWSLTKYVDSAMRLEKRDKNFDQAMDMIVNRLKLLTSPPAPAAAQK